MSKYWTVPDVETTIGPAWRQRIIETIGTAGLVFARTWTVIIGWLCDGLMTHLGIGLIFGMIEDAMLYDARHISGAHMNPALALGFTPARRLHSRDRQCDPFSTDGCEVTRAL